MLGVEQAAFCVMVAEFGCIGRYVVLCAQFVVFRAVVVGLAVGVVVRSVRQRGWCARVGVFHVLFCRCTAFDQCACWCVQRCQRLGFDFGQFGWWWCRRLARFVLYAACWIFWLGVYLRGGFCDVGVCARFFVAGCWYFGWLFVFVHVGCCFERVVYLTVVHWCSFVVGGVQRRCDHRFVVRWVRGRLALWCDLCCRFGV